MLTFKKVNKELAKHPKWAGEELVQGEGYLYFVGGNSDMWYTSNIAVCKLNHTTLESIVQDFEQFVKEYEEKQ
jgi:hypothetical protein